MHIRIYLSAGLPITGSLKMSVIDHELNTTFTNNSIPIRIGWEYRLMGKGDDYVEVVDISGKYVTIRGISGIILEKTMLLSAFDNIVKEVSNGGVNSLITEDGLYDITTEDDVIILWK